MAFDHIDTNHNGQINADELKDAFEFIEKHANIDISAKNGDWIKDQAIKDAGKGGPKDSMNVAEFGAFANATINHFGLCDELKKALSE